MTPPRRSAVLRFVVMLGIVNLFADFTYEGGRSIIGPFLAQLGAGAALVSIVSGVGEFFGYTLRAAAGYVADKTRRYWPMTIAGYGVNLLAVPALALAGQWPAAAVLITAERTGRAIRRPIVQNMLSHAKEEVGGGRAFGINESLDALGATIGPLAIALVIAKTGNYRVAFSLLLVPALLAIGLVTLVRTRYPEPQMFEPAAARSNAGYPRAYWIYVAAGAFIGFGFVDFSLIAFHFQRAGTLDARAIPLSYAAAMGAGAAGNYLLGRWFDRAGLAALVWTFLVGALFTPLVFYGTPSFAWAGMVLWGLNKGAQDTILKPAIAPLIAPDRRATAFGVFDMCFGTAWLAGSIVFGLLYDRSLETLVAVSLAGQLLSLPMFVAARKASTATRAT